MPTICSVGFGVEFNAIPGNDGDYYGLTTTKSVSTPSAGIGGYFGASKTYTIFQFNVYDEIDSVCVKIMEW